MGAEPNRGTEPSRPATPAADDTLGDYMAAIVNGDRPAFKALYDATASQLFSCALRILKRRDWAEEVLQESFIAIWKKAAQYETARGAVLGWMTMIVRHRCIDRLRLQGRRPKEDAIDDVSVSQPAALAAPDHASQSAEAKDVRRCLARLPDSQRTAISLAFYEGLTHEELAERLGAPLGTVKSWVRRGLLSLKECMET